MKKFILVLLVLAFSLSSCTDDPIKVEGIVYAKSTEVDSHQYKNSVNLDMNYLLAVRPIDTKKYHNFTADVPFYQYAQFNVGDKVVITTHPRTCVNGYEDTEKGRTFLVIALGIAVFCLFGYVISQGA